MGMVKFVFAGDRPWAKTTQAGFCAISAFPTKTSGNY